MHPLYSMLPVWDCTRNGTIGNSAEGTDVWLEHSLHSFSQDIPIAQFLALTELFLSALCTILQICKEGNVTRLIGSWQYLNMLLQRGAMVVARNIELAHFQLYQYTPSMGAAVLFIILFTLTTTLHFWQMIRTKTWFMIPFCIGGIFEIAGYIGRAISSGEAPNFTLGPYVEQATLLLVAPALLAASIYMELARIVQMVHGDKALFLRRRWLTRMFVSGDTVSFMLQAAGGGLMAGAKLELVNAGKALVLAGLVLQILYFALFVISGAIFHTRIKACPTEQCRNYPWERHMFSLYMVSVLILIRSSVRVVEYAQGFGGYIYTREVFLYVFDALLMFLAMVEMNWTYPYELTASTAANARAQDRAGSLCRDFVVLESIQP